MDRIPPEILCNIFLAALPHPTDPRDYLSSVAAPLRISHVCRSWRSLSLSFVLPPRARINMAQSSRLRRLYIRAPDFDLITGEEPLCSLTESAEISFHYDCSGSHMLRVWLDFLKAAPFLTEFNSDYYRCSDPPLPRAQNELLIQLPNLRVLKLRKGYFSFYSAPLIVDYVILPNLQVLFYTSNGRNTGRNNDMEAAILTNFIRRSLPPLTTLVIEWENAHEEVVIPILCLLPTLKYLRLWGAKVTRRFFDELTVPSNTGTDSLLGGEYAIICPVLETLYLHRVDFEEDTDSWVAFIAMLKSRPRGLGKSDVIHVREHRESSPMVEISVLAENIGDSRREVGENVQWDGMVIGNYDACKSHLF